MTAPERAAEWSIKTGYVAVSPAAYKTPAMEKYAKEFPAAIVARDQLDHAVPELSVHENGRIYKFVNDAVQSAVTGAQKPQEALAAAQAQADRVLKAYKYRTERGGRYQSPSGASRHERSGHHIACRGARPKVAC